jgi:hypothetical protein
MAHNLRGEFDPQRRLRREASVRQYNGAGMTSPQFNCGQNMSLFTYNAAMREYIDAPNNLLRIT